MTTRNDEKDDYEELGEERKRRNETDEKGFKLAQYSISIQPTLAMATTLVVSLVVVVVSYKYYLCVDLHRIELQIHFLHIHPSSTNLWPTNKQLANLKTNLIA